MGAFWLFISSVPAAAASVPGGAFAELREQAGGEAPAPERPRARPVPEQSREADGGWGLEQARRDWIAALRTGGTDFKSRAAGVWERVARVSRPYGEGSPLVPQEPARKRLRIGEKEVGAAYLRTDGAYGEENLVPLEATPSGAAFRLGYYSPSPGPLGASVDDSEDWECALDGGWGMICSGWVGVQLSFGEFIGCFHAGPPDPPPLELSYEVYERYERPQAEKR